MCASRLLNCQWFCCSGLLLPPKARRWPLCIDPQAQANKWLRALEGSARKLSVLRPGEKNLLRALEAEQAKDVSDFTASSASENGRERSHERVHVGRPHATETQRYRGGEQILHHCHGQDVRRRDTGR